MEDKIYLPVFALVSAMYCSLLWGGQIFYAGPSTVNTTASISINTRQDTSVLSEDLSLSFDQISSKDKIQLDTTKLPVKNKSKLKQKELAKTTFDQSFPQSKPLSEEEINKKSKQQKKKLRFTKNLGQTDKSVRYHINDAQADHYMLSNEIRTVLTLPKKQESKTSRKAKRRKPVKRGPKKGQEEQGRETESTDTTYSYGLKFLGTSGPQKVLESKQEIVKTIGRKNYIKGNGHFKDIPQYGQVAYESLWPGIDVDFYEADGQLKYDFVVAPGADPAQIRFELAGVSQISVDAKTGELKFKTPLGVLRKGSPYTYQLINDQKVEVKA